MSYSNLSKTLPADLTGTRRFNGVSGRLFTGTANPADNDEAMVHVILVDQNNTPLVVRADMDSGAGTAYRMGVGLLVPASGGPALVPGDGTNGLKVQDGALGTLAGAVTETAPATDTASSGLNGRLQRIAQRLTSLIALLPTSLGAGGGLKVDGSGTALPVSLASVPSHNVTNAGTFATQAATKPVETTVAISVPSGQTLSTAIDSAGYRSFGIWIPSTFDGTTITCQVSHSGVGGTYVDLYKQDGNISTMTVAASRAYPLPAELASWRYWAINCGTAQSGSSTDMFVTMRS